MAEDGLAIHTRDLGKSYGNIDAIKGLDLSVPRGTICGFLGPNGSGKTTAIKVLLGITQPTQGEARVLGYDVRSESLEIRRQVGYLAQSPTFYDHMTAREILRFVAGFYLEGPAAAIERRIAEMLELVGLEDKADRAIRGFSGGEKQRLGIAQAQMSQPALLILDEPASALDPMGRYRVLQIMEELRDRTTIFYSTHILDDVQRVSDTVVILRAGQLVSQGPIDTLLDGGIIYDVSVRHSRGEMDSLSVLEANIRRIPWVSQVTRTGGDRGLRWEISVSDPEAADKNLLRMIMRNEDIIVESYGLKRYELEEAFIKLMEGDTER